MITLTETASNYIQKKCEKNQSNGIRLGVKSSGCNGFMYTWDLVQEAAADDIVVPAGDKFLVVDKATINFVENSVINLNADPFNSTLVIENPLAKNTCGCGESFNV